MNQYFIPIAVGACGLTLFLSLSLYAAINRGSGRAIATEPTTETQDEAPKRGDDRREKKNYRIVRINRYGRNRTAVSRTATHPKNKIEALHILKVYGEAIALNYIRAVLKPTGERVPQSKTTIITRKK